MDNLIILKYLIIIEFVLLFVSGFFFGKGGQIVVIIASILFLTYVLLYAKGLGASFANSSRPIVLKSNDIIGIFLITLLFVYLAFGMHFLLLFLKNRGTINTLLLIWIVTIIGTVLTLSIIILVNDPVRLDYVATEKIIKDNQDYNPSLEKLEILYDRSLLNTKTIRKYIKLSEDLSKKYRDRGELPTILGNYTVKLMLKNLQNGELELVKALFNSYIDIIIPNSGVCDKSSDVVSLAIVLSQSINDKTIYQRAEKYILGEDFKIKDITNDVLLFNLACHYSILKDKDHMLMATEQALIYGKLPIQFLEDRDFENYKNDKDFLTLLKKGVIHE